MPRARFADRNVVMTVVAAALAAGVFAVDLTIPLGFAGGVLYIPIILLARQAQIRGAVFIFAAAATVLTVLGYQFSPSSDVAAGTVLANRGIAVVAIWITALIVHQREAVRSSLQARDDLYSALVETQSELVCRHLPNGVLTFVNDAYQRKFSVNNESLIGRRYIDLLAPENREEAERVLAKLDTGSEPYTHERRVVTLSGEIFDLQWTRQAILDDDGRIVEYQAVGHDITDLKRTETALRDSEELYRTLIQTQAELICRYLPNGVLTFVNDAYCRYVGETREKLIGRRYIDLLAPGDRMAAEQALASAVDQQTPTTFERRYQTGDGGIHHVQWTRLPIRDDQGLIIEYQAVGSDITDLKRAETALRESEVLHRRLLDVSPDAIIVKCEDEIVLANPAAVKLFGAETADEIVGRQSLDFVHPGDHAKVLKAREIMLRQGQSVRIASVREMRLDGTAVDCETSAAPFLWEDKPASLIIVRDMTALREAEQALREAKDAAERANTVKSRFLAAASHDLRQPIYALSIFVATLARRIRDPKSRDLIAKMEQAIESTNELLVALLDISKLEAGVVEPNMADFPVQGILTEIAAEFAPSAEARGNVLRVVPSRLAVRSDRILLESILRNLVSNAVRYTSGGRILVGCRRRGAMVRFEVRDSGIGIPRDKQKAIFEEFHRLEGAAEPGDAGLGLGLAIVERTAGLLGYRIELDSEPGRGSRFRFDVPAGDAEAGADAIAPMALPSLLLGATVAVIDDDREVLDALDRQLAGWGCDCFAAGSAALVVRDLASANRVPDLIVADYHLADGKTGIEAVRMIRDRWGANLPAVIITGDASNEPVHRAEELHLPLMIKPIRPARMRALLLHVLQMREEAKPSLTVRQ